MVLKSGDIKRLFIYFFYDADGIVDRYIPYMLNALKPYSTEIFVVCNGKLSNEGRKIFSNITQKILVRENKGFDVWAYKAAIDSYGWEELRKFDEVSGDSLNAAKNVTKDDDDKNDGKEKKKKGFWK